MATTEQTELPHFWTLRRALAKVDYEDAQFIARDTVLSIQEFLESDRGATAQECQRIAQLRAAVSAIIFEDRHDMKSNSDMVDPLIAALEASVRRRLYGKG